MKKHMKILSKAMRDEIELSRKDAQVSRTISSGGEILNAP
jgi:hypothetical protein